MAKTKRTLTFAIDFDGTLAEHTFPTIGAPVPGAVETCLALLDKGYKLVLNTVRSGETLEAARLWCIDKGLHFYGWNSNPDQKAFSSSPKVFADIYIDDAALGCPLIVNKGKRPYVDWAKVRFALIENGIL